MTELVPMAMSIAQAVKCCGLGRSSLYKAIAERRLKIRKAGARTLIEVSALQEFVAGLPRADGT
jgi:hypothetical protein